MEKLYLLPVQEDKPMELQFYIVRKEGQVYDTIAANTDVYPGTGRSRPDLLPESWDQQHNVLRLAQGQSVG